MKSSLFFLAMLGFTCAAGAETLKFASLSANETIKIEFKSEGDFQEFVKRYEIRGGPAKLFSASLVETQWHRPKKGPGKKIGTVTLAADEASGFDELLAFYRRKNPGVCTTVDHIRVEYERGGKKIGREEFKDTTCVISMRRFMSRDADIRKHFGGEYDWDALDKVVSFSQVEERIKKKAI
jgi:hypothetical protein